MTGGSGSSRRPPLLGRTANGISAVLLSLLFFVYLGLWVSGNPGMLFDPGQQNDDAAIHLMPFHRYARPSTLAHDPVANDMLAASTLGHRLPYMALVPFFGVLVTAKIVQLLCLAIAAAAALVLWGLRKTGLAAGVLMLFFVLHTPEVVGRIAGGLQRSFAYPLLLLWVAGAIRQRRPVRYAAALAGAVTYPAAMALTAAGEGVLAFRNALGRGCRAFWRGMAEYALLCVLCAGLALASSAAAPDAGPLPTLEEAAANPAFFDRGRTDRLPLAHPVRKMLTDLCEPFRAGRESYVFGPAPWYARGRNTGALCLLAGVAALAVAGLVRVPPVFPALLCASVFVYGLARLTAFRLLYIPERYLTYGMTTISVGLLPAAVGALFPAIRHPVTRAALRNLAAASLIVLTCLVTGDGIATNTGMFCRRAKHADLWDRLEKLPRNSRIAAHPMDACAISLLSGLAATPGYEQLIPWYRDAWERNRRLAESTLSLLYATDRGQALGFCDAEGVTHILLARSRYRPEYFEFLALVFEPINNHVRRILRDTRLPDVVLARPPAEAIVFESAEFILLDVGRLRQAWGT